MVGVPDVSQKPLTPPLYISVIPPDSAVGCCARGGIFDKTVSLFLLPVLMWLCGGGSVQLVFRIFFPEGIVSYVSIDLLCPWERLSPGSSCAAILNYLSLIC